MRQGPNQRRSRGRGPRKPHMPARSQNFDNGGQEARVRGNTYQVLEKYLALARDAHSVGDRIAAENYLQHAEHYYRVINASGDQGGRNRPPQGQDANGADQPTHQRNGDGSGDANSAPGEKPPSEGNE